LTGVRAILAVLAVATVLGQTPSGMAQAPGSPAVRELVVGTKVARPLR